MLKCLSVGQPCASLLVWRHPLSPEQGLKPLENRPWYSSHRGPLLIYAAKQLNCRGLEWLRMSFPYIEGFMWDLPRSAIIGQVEMVDCTNDHPSAWFTGPFALVFKRPVQFQKPIRWRGGPGLFDVPDEVLADTQYIGQYPGNASCFFSVRTGRGVAGP